MTKVVKALPITMANVVSTTAVEAYPEWSSGTTYTLDTRVLRSGLQRVYQCIQGPSTGNTPETSGGYWADVGPTNAWAMFDSKISTQTEAASMLSVTLKPGICNSLCLAGLVGNSLSVTVRDGPGGEVVYQADRVLDGTIISDWYQYFFEPFVQLESVVLCDLPPYSNAHITVQIKSGGAVKCGTLMAGTFYELGDAQYGATSGIISYSRKDTDQYGTTTFLKRASSDKISMELMLTNAQLNKVRGVLKSLDAVPCFWVGTEVPGYEVLSTLGFYREFSIAITYPSHSLCTLEIEGLT